MQLVCPLVEYVPGVHAVGVLALGSGHAYPAGHVVHKLPAAVYCPAEHTGNMGVQLEASAALVVPGPHSVHRVWPANENVPARQPWMTSESGEGQANPAGHVLHVELRRSRYSPAVQVGASGVHCAAPASLVYPSEHGVHAAAFSSE